MILDQTGGLREIPAEEVCLGGGELQVGLDFGGDSWVGEIFCRGGNQPRILVEHEAAGDVVAEILLVFLCEG